MNFLFCDVTVNRLVKQHYELLELVKFDLAFQFLCAWTPNNSVDVTIEHNLLSSY